jgi:hypothetical protein
VAVVVAAYTLGGVACSAFSATSDGDEAGAAAAQEGGRTDDGASGGDAHDARSEGAAITGAPFCDAYMKDPTLVFCDDFDSPAAAGRPFGFAETALTSPVATMSVVADGDRAAVLQVAIEDATSGPHEATLLRHLGISNGPLSLQLDYDIEIVKNDVSSTTLAALHLSGATCEASFGLGAFDGMTVGGTRNRDTTPRAYVVGEWHHVTTSLTASPASSTGFREVTTYAGEPLVDRDAHSSASGSPATCGANDLVMGIGECGSGPAHILVRFDNVLVRQAP